MTIRIKIASMLSAGALLALSFANNSIAAPAREEVRLLTATQVLEEVQAMPDQRLPDTLLAHAYGIAVIPDVTQIALIFGGRHGNGVLTMRDTLNSPWSNPVFVSLSGASGGLQVGMQASDIILVFTTKSGVDGIALGKLTLGAIGIEAELCEGGVGLSGGHVVVGEDMVVHVGGADGDAEIADADSVTVGCKQLLE